MRFVNTSGRLVLLVGLAYLGLYVYGLVMGVFNPLEMAGFTVVAVVAVAAYATHVVLMRRAMRDPRQRRELTREMSREREERGF